MRTPDAPYATRVLVRRPIKRTRMSGTVVVEPLNPSNTFGSPSWKNPLPLDDPRNCTDIQTLVTL